MCVLLLILVPNDLAEVASALVLLVPLSGGLPTFLANQASEVGRDATDPGNRLCVMLAICLVAGLVGIHGHICA